MTSPSRGGVAMYSILLVTLVATLVVVTFVESGRRAFRATGNAYRAQKVLAATESGLNDAVRQLRMTPSTSGALAALTIDGVTVNRTVTPTVITATGTGYGLTANLRADCNVTTGACVVTRY